MMVISFAEKLPLLLSWRCGLFLGLALSPVPAPAAGISPASEVIFDVSFNGVADGLREDFSLISNSVGNPSWGNATGEARMTIDEASSGTVGCVSDDAFSGEDYSLLTVSIAVDSIVDPDGGPTHNGHWVGLTGNRTQLWNNSELAGGVDGWALGVRFLAGGIHLVYDNASGNEVVMAPLGSYSLVSLKDGYAVDFLFQDEGWGICLTGIDGSVDASGTWPVGFDYTTLTEDDSVFTGMTYQQGNEAGTVVKLASLSIYGDPADSAVLVPTVVFTTDAQSPATTGATVVVSGDDPADSDLYLRERRNASEVDRRVSSFLHFDVSGLSSAEVNIPGFSATFTADYDFQLNSSNPGATAVIGRVTNGAWDGATSLPLHAWGRDDAVDRTILIPDIAALPPGASVSADVTSIVRGWVNGTTDNFGFAVFIEELESNGVGLSNAQLVIASSADLDGDGLPDDYEIANGLNPNDASDRDTDIDSDGLSNFAEYTAGTSPQKSDSDEDGLSDGEEVQNTLTDPNDADSDDDGLLDGQEVNTVLSNPLDADSDDDFLNDFEELIIFRTNPTLADSDNDTFRDGVELAALSNPLEASITPSGQDSDDDGLLDTLEIAVFGNLAQSGLDDSDGDGFPNIVEQAFGSGISDASFSPSIGIDSSMGLTFRRQRVAGVGYELLVSLDLKRWQPFLGFLTENAATPIDSDYEEARYQAGDEHEKLFVKVKPRTEITGRPNIILFYTDDQGYGDMGANNQAAKFTTPSLDLLAAQGINFTDCHSSDTVCSPSRYGLLTGRYCWRTVLKQNVIGADDPALIANDRTTLASLLKDQGYATAMVGKWHLGMDIPGTNGNRDFSQPIRDMPLDVGFDHFYGIPASLNFGYLAWIEGRYTAVNPTQFTAKKANNLPGVFSDYRITPPYNRTSGLEAASDFDDVLCLTRFTEEAIEWMTGQVEDAQSNKPFFIYIPYTSPHKPVIPRSDFLGLSDAGAYGDFMMETDHHIGNILKFLDEKGLANNTMVIVSSDNGPETTYKSRVTTYDHDSAGIYRGGKRDIYEGGHRVPFVVRWPAGIKSPGRSWDRPVCQTDLLATCAEMLGVTLDDDSGEDSVSFYEVLRDDSASLSRLPMIHHSFSGRFSIREGDWKLIMPHEGSGYELYNLATDPTESNDVKAANPVKVEDLETKITDIVTRGRTTAGSAVGNDTGWWDDLEWIEPVDY
ncbi:sulfatase-like hydrolase/transferase [Roseibacillus persicicus]|uniref:sulfatase-like hydrolase/transferase n=1 Tax=Roseibacillus persicicus TaxID=454148 RepID=UPI00398B537F